MFRTKALAKMLAPEKLNEPQKMKRRKTYMALWTLAALMALAAIIGVKGQVPEEGMGQGILITPGSVKPIQAGASGQILRWLVSEGDFVEKNQVIGILDQPTITQKLDQSRAKTAELQARNKIMGELKVRFTELEKRAIDTQRLNLKSKIDYFAKFINNTRKSSNELHRHNEEMLDVQYHNLMEAKKYAVLVEKKLRKKLGSYRRLKAENLLSDEQLRNVRHDHEEAKLEVLDLNQKIQELELKRIELDESQLRTQNLIASQVNTLTNLKLQLRELDNTIAQIDKDITEFKFRQENQLKDSKRMLERNRKQLSLDREIKTEFSGRVIELTVAAGQMVSQGQQVIQIDTRAEQDEFIALTYFHAKEGKQLKKGMKVRISPSTVDKRQYGCIIGRIDSISDYPVTVDAAAAFIGNKSVAQRLTAGGYEIEAFIHLERNAQTPSGYAWTSERGPDVTITAGTKVDVWVTIEQRSPISYILPKIKKWGGV